MRLRVAPRLAGGPVALPVEALDASAELVSLADPRPRGARLLASPAVGAYARSVAPGRRVVVVGTDDEGAAAIAERLAAHGVDAAWLVGGVGAWTAAGRAMEAT